MKGVHHGEMAAPFILPYDGFLFVRKYVFLRWNYMKRRINTMKFSEKVAERSHLKRYTKAMLITYLAKLMKVSDAKLKGLNQR